MNGTGAREDAPGRSTPDDALERAIAFFEAISPADVGRIADIYAPDALFRDPFNDVRGTDAIARVFAHMFETLDAPRFLIRESVRQGEQAFVVWDFEFRFRRGSPRTVQRIHGASHLRFDTQGRISHHRDYWDAAQEFYEKLPLLGALMRWLRHKAGGR